MIRQLTSANKKYSDCFIKAIVDLPPALPLEVAC